LTPPNSLFAASERCFSVNQAAIRNFRLELACLGSSVSVKADKRTGASRQRTSMFSLFLICFVYPYLLRSTIRRESELTKAVESTSRLELQSSRNRRERESEGLSRSRYVSPLLRVRTTSRGNFGIAGGSAVPLGVSAVPLSRV